MIEGSRHPDSTPISRWMSARCAPESSLRTAYRPCCCRTAPSRSRSALIALDRPSVISFRSGVWWPPHCDSRPSATDSRARRGGWLKRCHRAKGRLTKGRDHVRPLRPGPLRVMPIGGDCGGFRCVDAERVAQASAGCRTAAVATSAWPLGSATGRTRIRQPGTAAEGRDPRTATPAGTLSKPVTRSWTPVGR
jgi:hypothetical protein